MNRAEIPDALAKARASDIARIPDRILKTLSRAQLAERLVAAGEYRRRAHEPRLDADLFRYRIGLAGEVLTTADAKRAAELVKGAGVGVTIGAGRAAARPAASPAGTALRKEAAPASGGKSIYVHTPTLDMLSAAKSCDAGITELIRKGALGHLRQDIASLEQAVTKACGGGKAAEYEQQAARVTDPETRRGYRELAARERENAGAR